MKIIVLLKRNFYCMQSKDLAEILTRRNKDRKYDNIILRASLNGYHDYKFDKVPGHPEYGACVCPKVQLVTDLSDFPELSDIRKQVIDGVFDDSPDSEDAEDLRKMLMEEKAHDLMFEQIGLKVPTAEERSIYQ